MSDGGFALIPVALGFGIGTGLVGRRKGSSFWLWFLIGAIVPIIGLAAAFLYRWDADELRRQCPRCGRVVKLHDAMCMRCGTDLDFPDVAIVPESGMRPT
jgi:ribosomal protein S27AE